MRSVIVRSLLALAVSLALAHRGSAAPAPHRLVRLAPDAALAPELARYGLTLYALTDGTNVMKALHYAPQAKGSGRLPMIIYFPGSGEIGDPIRQFRIRTLFNRVIDPAFQRRHPCHLLALSPPETATTLMGGLPGRPTPMQRLIHELIRSLVRHTSLGIDRDRLYVTGYSYGGSGAYALAQHYPGEFAAVAPISGLPPLPEYLDRHHPGNWWHFYNEGDYAARDLLPEGLLRFRDRTNEAGGDFRIGSYPADGHDAWTRAWRDDALWEWMFSKSLKRGSLRAAAPSINLAGSICTASVPGANVGSGPERVVDGLDETGYRPALTFGRKDWWMIVFPHPVSGKVEIASGDLAGNDRLKGACVEVATDGRRWERVGTFSAATGLCQFTRQRRFSYLRIRPEGERLPPFLLRRLTIAK